MEELNKEREETKKGLGDRIDKYTPAPPDYREEPPYPESEEMGMPMPKGESVVNKVIPVGLAVLISIILVATFFSPVNKSVYQSDITRLETDLVAIREVDVAQNTKIDKVVTDAQAAVSSKSDEVDSKIVNAVANIDQKVASATSNLGDYATKSSMALTNEEISALKNKVSNLEGSASSSVMTDLQNKVNTAVTNIAVLTAENAALKIRIVTLEEEGVGISSAKKPVLDLSERSAPTGSGWSPWAVGLNLEIENNTKGDIIIYEEGLRIYIDLTTPGTIDTVHLLTTNQNLAWASIQPTIPYFYNAKSIYIDQGDTETLRLVLTITLKLNDPITSYEMETELGDWDYE